jgi:hypothetical protein
MKSKRRKELMYIKRLIILPLAAIMALLVPIAGAEAAEGKALENREEVMQFVENAFEAQTSLSEKPRTMEEVEAVLAPYFTDSYTGLFLEENLSQEEDGHIVYGTDFGLYYIPFFDFSEETKVVIDQEQIHVFEYFPGVMEGPVTYAGHYEGLRIEKTDSGWKVAEWLYDELPQNVITKATSDLVYKDYQGRALFSRESERLRPLSGSYRLLQEFIQPAMDKSRMLMEA